MCYKSKPNANCATVHFSHVVSDWYIVRYLGTMRRLRWYWKDGLSRAEMVLLKQDVTLYFETISVNPKLTARYTDLCKCNESIQSHR
jgi:hypothetical protein